VGIVLSLVCFRLARNNADCIGCWEPGREDRHAVDSPHVDTVFLRSLYILVVIEHGRRRVHLAGVSAHPTGTWVSRQAHHLLMELGDRAALFRFLIPIGTASSLPPLTRSSPAPTSPLSARQRRHRGRTRSPNASAAPCDANASITC
jgi:hypothetical protein